MAETKDCEVVQVMGRRWDSSRPAFFTALEGLSLEDIVLQSIEEAYRDKIYNKTQRRILLHYARCRVNGVEKDRKYWKHIFPQKGDRIEILHGVRGGGGGGGGGKNPLATILSVLVVVVAAAATFWAGGAGVTIPLGLTATQFTTGVGLLAAGALMAINMLFPAKPPSIGGLGGGGDAAAKESPTYSINGGKNAHNIDGYVPLVLGRHRQTPPLGAKSWTYWHGDDQYFNMLVVWGHEHVTVSDFRIGDTALSKFSDVTHVFHQSTTGKGLKYFGWQYNEESVGATLGTGWTVRTVGEGTALSVDVEFPGGLCTINRNNGNKQKRSIQIELQYKTTAGGSWKGFSTKIEKSFSGKTLSYSYQDINNSVSVFYKSGKIQAVPRGQSVSGGIQIYPQSGLQYCYGCGVSCKPSGTKMKVTVQPGVFKKGGKIYSVGGGRQGFSYGGEYDNFYYGPYVYGGKAQTLTINTPLVIGVSEAGNVHKGSGFRNLWPSKSSGVSGGGVSWEEERRFSYGGEYDDYHYGWNYFGWKASVGGGSFTVAGHGRATISGSKQKQLVRNYQVTGLSLNSYDVRIRRITAKSSDSYIIDDCAWSTMRAIVQKPAFSTPVPICVSELRIRASEQLSGYVTEFSGLCYSKLPDWTPQTTKKVNGKTVTVPGNWDTWRNTSNPASIMRYLLTSKHSLIKPFPAKRLDNNAIVALWNWCKKNDYRFDFIADSEEALWSRLVQVLSPAMAGPTTDVDGLWGAIIDQPNKTVRQMFTPRNSWGMNIQRGFAKLPDALRVKFVDETDDWTQKEGFVYNDGFNKDGSGGKKKANDVIEWSFEGVTNWKRMYKLARYHLAQMLHRQTTVTINTDWEWLAVHRGDLVGLSSDTLMNTFGTARVMRKVYKNSGLVDSAGATAYIYEDSLALIDTDTSIELIGPGESIPDGGAFVGVELDDTIYYTSPSPARYGIAVRSATGQVNVLEITPQYGEESSIVYFSDRTQAEKAAPDFGDLVSVSLLGSEYEEYLVSSVTPGENMSAQVTLVPYKTAEIMKAANGLIPAYEAPVVLDAVKGAQDLPTPSLRSCVSDERVAQVSASGSVVVCIGATWSVPATAENLSYFTIELNATQEDTGGSISGSNTNAEEYAVAAGAEVGKKYFCKIRIHDPATGRTSAWSNVVAHTVAGLVMPPPTPQNVRISTVYPQGIRLSWDEVQVIDLRRYKITGSATGQTRGKETEYVYSPKNQTGKLVYSVWAVDTTDHESSSAGTASIVVEAPKKPVATLARLENEGVVVAYEDAKQTWPVTAYEWSCGEKTASSTGLRAVVAPTVPAVALTVKGRARDYFLNWGEWSSETAVDIVPPEKPVITVEASETGTVMFKWQNCRTVTDIVRYSLSGAFSGSTASLFVVVDVSTLHDDNGDNAFAVTEAVKAVDKWGVESEESSGSFMVYPPDAPAVNVEKRTDGIYLTWQDCKTVFNIARYVVQDIDLNLEYSIDGTSQALKPRAPGLYHFAVQAVDVAGLWSSKTTLSYAVTGVEPIHGRDLANPDLPYTLTAKVDGSDVLLEWAVPDSSWPIDLYAISNMAQVVIGRAKTSFFRFPAPVAGAYEYGVTAKDIAENWGQAGRRAGITIVEPPAPKFPEPPSFSGAGVSLSWKQGTPSLEEGEYILPVAAWEVVHWWTYDPDGDGVALEVQHDYGRIDVDTIEISATSTGQTIDSKRSVPELSVGTHSFLVRAIDTAGNVGEYAEAVININPPGKVTFQNCSVVDNNVMLYWSIPDSITLPIEYYLFEEVERSEGNGETVEYFAEIGRIDALFAASFESGFGTYVYAVTPVDVAGNRGERASIAMEVSQPPDFVLYHEWPSNFSGGNPESPGRLQPNGGRTNFILDGEGHMIGPFADATWNENLAAMAAAKSATAANIAWQNKVQWGFDGWLEPSVQSAQYVEIVDIGTVIPSTTINVSIDSVTLAGSPVFSCRIETSLDGESWTQAVEDSMQALAEKFQFVRYTIGVSGGVVSISGIRYKLSVKRKMDFGKTWAVASDQTIDGVLYKANGDGYDAANPASTPMEWGTWVSFNTKFADIESLPKPNVINNLNEYTAYTVFDDVYNPEGFRVFVLDKNGNRVTAQVDWAAYGV